jgi:uncharacterized protein with PIN domain
MQTMRREEFMPFGLSFTKHKPAAENKSLRCKNCNGPLAPFKT